MVKTKQLQFEICALLRYYAVHSGNSLWSSHHNLSVPSSRSRNPKIRKTYKLRRPNSLLRSSSSRAVGTKTPHPVSYNPATTSGRKLTTESTHMVYVIQVCRTAFKQDPPGPARKLFCKPV